MGPYGAQRKRKVNDPQGRLSQIWLQAKYESKTVFIKSHFLAKILETM
jgi:hypothetical protein